MTTDEIERAAFSGEDILLNLIDEIDKMYYVAVMCLYDCYRVEAISQKNAAERKKTLRDMHDRFDLDREIYRRHRAIEDALGGYHKELETCGCEHCKKLLRLIDGREFPDEYWRQQND